MIKLMIVDDESVIRHGLHQSINWENYGVTIIGEAQSGNAALEKALILRPDMIITDIRMTDGDGLGMAKQLLEFLPQVRIIMLSGYSDKEYMIEAIQLGVRNYLLKPAGADQILQAVLMERDGILIEQKKDKQHNQMENIINENIDILKAHFLEELLDGNLSAEHIRQKAAFFQINLSGPKYGLFTAVPDQNRTWETIQIISLHLENYSPVFVPRRDGTVAAILNLEQDVSQEELLPLAAEVNTRISTMLLPCYGRVCDLELLHILYDACLEMVARSVWFEGPCLTTGADVHFDAISEQVLTPFERNIVQSVRAGNNTAMLDEINILFQRLEQVKPPGIFLRDIILGIARSIQIFSENNDLCTNVEELFKGRSNHREIKEAIFSILNNDYSRYGPQIRNALNFITKNCTAELSLTDVAASLYISPSYLTRLLKNKTGRGFNDWLHIIRIGKAKELLDNSDLRHYEIAEKVGYSSYKIFSEYFSRIVGCSARNYRDRTMGTIKKTCDPIENTE